MSAVPSTTSVKGIRNSTHRPAPVAERYGMLKVLLFVPKKGWLCKCDCGVEKFIEGNPLRGYRHMSCGCNAKTRQANSLRCTLEARKKRTVKAKSRRVRHPSHGTRCWVCRNRTGATAVVALCKICERGCV